MEFTLDAQSRRSALHYFDKDGQPVDGAWGVQRYSWERPEPGVIVETRFNKKGESAPLRPDFLFHRVRLDFGHDDLLDFMTHVDAQGEDRALAGLEGPMSFEYDRHGNLARQQLRAMNGELLEESRLEYSADGSRLLFVRFFDAKGRPKSPAGLPPTLAGLVAQQFHYDARGLRSAPVNLGADGKPLAVPPKT